MKKDGGFLGSGDQAVKHQKLKIEYMYMPFHPPNKIHLFHFPLDLLGMNGLSMAWGIFASPAERPKPMPPTLLSMWSTYMAKRERLRSRGSIDKPDPPVETAGCWAVGWWICLAI